MKQTKLDPRPFLAGLALLSLAFGTGSSVFSQDGAPGGVPVGKEALKAEHASKLLDRLAQQEKIRRQEKEFMAQKLLEAANRDLLAERWEEAIRTAKKALDLDPKNEEIKKALGEARRMAGLVSSKNPAVLLKRVEAEKRVAIQVSKHEMARLLDSGKKLYGLRRYQQAIDSLENVLTLARSIPADDEAQAATKEARDTIDASREAIRREGILRKAHAKTASREILLAERRRQKDLIETRKRALLGRARYALEQGNHALAGSLVEELLAVDPLNSEARELVNQVGRTRRGDRGGAARSASADSREELLVMAQEAAKPVTERSRYPSNWGEIIAKRPTRAVAEEDLPEWKKRVLEEMEKRVSFDFLDTPLADVVAFLQNLTGVNMVIDPNATEGDDVPVTLKVNDMRLGAALDWILRLCDLSYALKDEVVYVSTKDRIRDKENLQIHDVRDLLARIPDYSGTGLPSIGEGGSGGGGGEDLFGEGGGDGESFTGEDLVDFIKETVAPDSWGDGDDEF